MARETAVLPTARRLRALMHVLGFHGRGSQRRFAEEIRIAEALLSFYLRDRPLTYETVVKIARRFRGVSTDFLILGRSGGALDSDLEKELFRYEREHNVALFSD